MFRYYNKSNHIILRSGIFVKSHVCVAPEEGIEPPLAVLETAALPLYYSGIRGASTWVRTRDPRLIKTVL